MRSWLTLGAAGGLGVLARHVVQQAVPRHRGVPWGTLVVNITGALAIGFIAAFVVHKLRTPLWVQEALTVGFLGGYTTFSTFALEPSFSSTEVGSSAPPRTASVACSRGSSRSSSGCGWVVSSSRRPPSPSVGAPA